MEWETALAHNGSPTAIENCPVRHDHAAEANVTQHGSPEERHWISSCVSHYPISTLVRQALIAAVSTQWPPFPVSDWPSINAVHDAIGPKLTYQLHRRALSIKKVTIRDDHARAIDVTLDGPTGGTRTIDPTKAS